MSVPGFKCVRLDPDLDSVPPQPRQPNPAPPTDQPAAGEAGAAQPLPGGQTVEEKPAVKNIYPQNELTAAASAVGGGTTPPPYGEPSIPHHTRSNKIYLPTSNPPTNLHVTAPMMEVASGDGSAQLIHRPWLFSEMKEASQQLPRVQDELYRQRVLELNASDERGIQVIREKVKNFAQLTVAGTRTDGKPCPPFKIIILDEADSMTAPAQAALRRTMEKESRTTRFCLICNYISRIIEPLTSRCSKFRFKPLANQIQEERLLEICEKENLKYTKESIAALVKVSEGDLRKAITFLQSAARLNVNKEITERTVIEIAGVIPPKMIDNLLQICFKGTFEKLEVAVRNMVDEGYAATQILSQLHESIIEQDLSDKQKSAITEKMAVVGKCLSDGADEYLQMLSLCSVIMQQASQNN
ncbi:replication factor C subunit 4-like [Micropterus dolomieu]|uniref:replication factor C subunit 4-like n=1 Tax=Micropterus dolomieu TaxID=147949 RepID=UPI001E8DE5CD|nr:replication factor C subunit 4-like [Micropterus dolomieu]